jgi:threonine/homoserine/homoserine lactone efflux protein
MLAGLALPQVATTMLWIAGVFYLAWFPLLALDLLKRGQA